MKKNILLQMLFVAALGFAVAACGGSHQHDHNSGTEQSATESNATEQGPEYTSAYVCPMHCEGSGSDKPGQCPTCGMDYVALSEHTHDGHSH